MKSTKVTGNVTNRSFFLRILENLSGFAVFDHFTKIEEGCLVSDTLCLLHVMGDHDDRIAFLELYSEFFDVRGGDRIEGRSRFIHQENIRLYGKGSGDAETLLLTAGEPEGRLMQAVFQFVPDGSLTQAAFYDLIQILFLGDAFQARTISDIIIDALREWIRLLKNHADMAAKNDRIDIFVGIDTGKKDLPFYTAGRDEVIHAVQRAQEGRFPTAGRPDERGDLVLFNAKIDALQCLK